MGVVTYLLFFVYCGSVLAALAAMVAAGVSDFRTMTIPNRYPVAILGAFFVAFPASAALMRGESPFDPLAAHIMALGLVLAVTFAMFGLRVWGAGDSKLASAIAVWLGLKGLVVFFMVMAVAGMALVALGKVLQYSRRFPADPAGLWPSRLRAGQRVLPYGIAIACGGVAALAEGGIFDVLALLQAIGARG